MTNSVVVIAQYGDRLRGIVPAGAPTVLDAAAELGVMVLEVAGGHLAWDVLAGQVVPAAVIDDIDLAQEWVWAIYGEPIALALESDRSAEVTVDPALPPLAVSARRLAYAHWAARWWPASTLDGIAPLDPVLLDRDIATLTEECESLVDGADAIVPIVEELIESFPRASDYALAAGDDNLSEGLVLARASRGWDWRRCPPGVVDASERALSWKVVRDAGVTTVTVEAVAAPGLSADLPAHLVPWVRIDSGSAAVETALRPESGAWVGAVAISSAGAGVQVDLHVPGVGTAAADGVEAVELRRRIRDFATGRLQRAARIGDDDAADAPLLAEIAAAAEDSDF